MQQSQLEPASDTGILTDEQKEHFLQYGHVILPACFSRAAAQELIDDAYLQLGYDSQDPTTWVLPLAFLFPSRPFPIREFAPKLWKAICEVVGGQERMTSSDCGMGQFVINFWRGRDEPWEEPSPRVKGWHKDGNFFRHFLDSPEQGLLVVPLLSDVSTKGGGTVFAADSVPVVARFLAEHPEGVLPRDFDFQSLVEQCHDFREFTGQAGDVALLHPYMLHSFSQNHLGVPRFITNININLADPMNFDRADASEYSLVERAILRGLDVERLSFQPTSPREQFDPKK